VAMVRNTATADPAAEPPRSPSRSSLSPATNTFRRRSDELSHLREKELRLPNLQVDLRVVHNAGAYRRVRASWAQPPPSFFPARFAARAFERMARSSDLRFSSSAFWREAARSPPSARR
jgi:hypothetical protein